jgi:hypothetical protein
MRKYLIIGVSLAAVFAASEAQARYVWYFGKKAEAFIAKYLPGALIPGAINQAFVYDRRRHGWASCRVPAMGARSEGEISECYVKF